MKYKITRMMKQKWCY